jgi:hypothetical protein
MFNPNYQLYSSNIGYELVSLFVFPLYLRGDCNGFPVVPEENIISHYQYPKGCPMKQVYLHYVRMVSVGWGNYLSLIFLSV